MSTFLDKILEDLEPVDLAEIYKIDGFDNSVVGITIDNKLVYDYDLMVLEYCKDNDCDLIDAIEWIEYNTIRSLPYLGEKHL